jgi:hypothetical protein
MLSIYKNIRMNSSDLQQESKTTFFFSPLKVRKLQYLFLFDFSGVLY